MPIEGVHAICSLSPELGTLTANPGLAPVQVRHQPFGAQPEIRVQTWIQLDVGSVYDLPEAIHVDVGVGTGVATRNNCVAQSLAGPGLDVVADPAT